jgi:hypothetical protein
VVLAAGHVTAMITMVIGAIDGGKKENKKSSTSSLDLLA